MRRIGCFFLKAVSEGRQSDLVPFRRLAPAGNLDRPPLGIGVGFSTIATVRLAHQSLGERTRFETHIGLITRHFENVW